MKFMFCAALHSLAISTIQHLFGQHIAHYPTKSKRNKSVRNHSRKHEIKKKKKTEITLIRINAVDENQMNSSDFIVFIYV